METLTVWHIFSKKKKKKRILQFSVCSNIAYCVFDFTTWLDNNAVRNMAGRKTQYAMFEWTENPQYSRL